jgi:hypothetical protein
MILAGRGLAAASVDQSGAVPRGAAAGVRGAAHGQRCVAQPGELEPRGAADLRAVPLQFRERCREDEARELYLGYSVPGAGEPLFRAASANLNPWTEAKVDSTNPTRGPMLIVSADSDHTVPWAIASASYKKQKRNPGVTEIVKMAGRGHSLTIDAGWREVAEKALEFVKRFT